jgi:RNA polymerase sigma factor (sigma-70 family)
MNENKGLVLAVVDKCRPSFLSSRQWKQLREDCIQVGYIGLLRAIKAFNKEKGTQFNTLAWLCIHRAIRRFLYKERHYLRTNIDDDYLLSINSRDMTSVIDKLWAEIPFNMSNIEYKVITYRCKGYTYKEIGKIFNKNNIWARSICIKTIQRLKELNNI